MAFGCVLEGYYLQPELWEISRYEVSPEQRLRARVIAALIDPEVESVLDVGCGNGFITRQIKAPRVVGLDPSEEALTHFEGECVLGSADRLPFDDDAFDAVVCAEVLEHLPEGVYQKAVSELARVARRCLVIGVPYDQDLRMGMTRCADCGHEYHIDLHQRRFRSPEQLAAAFPDFGLRASVFVGRKRRIRYGWFRWLRYKLEGPWAKSQMAVCPRCGSRRTTVRQGPLSRLARRAFDPIRWRLPKEPFAHWMIVMLSSDAA